MSAGCLVALQEPPGLDERRLLVWRRRARRRCYVAHERSRGGQAYRVLIYFLIWGHEGQQKNIDATGSFTYHAIHSDCPAAVLHTHLHVSETLCTASNSRVCDLKAHEDNALRIGEVGRCLLVATSYVSGELINLENLVIHMESGSIRRCHSAHV